MRVCQTEKVEPLFAYTNKYKSDHTGVCNSGLTVFKKMHYNPDLAVLKDFQDHRVFSDLNKVDQITSQPGRNSF